MSQGAPPPFMEDDDDREPLVNPNRVPHGGQPAQGKQGLTEAEARAAERQRVQAKQKGPQGSQQAHPQHHPPHDRPQSGRGRGGAAPQGGPTDPKNAPHPQHTAPSAPPSGTTASTPSKPVVLPQEDRVLIPYVAGSRPNIEDGMKKGTIIVGALRTMAWSTGIAWVTCPGLGVDVEVHTVEARGSALPGDIVAVELTEDRTLWTDRPLKGGDEAGEEDMITASHTCFSKRNVDGPKATLPDGREVMYVVDDHAHTSGKIARSHPVLDVYATVGTQPPVDQIPDTKKPRGVVVAVMVRRFTMLHPSRLIPGNDGAARVVPNRYYRFRSYDKSFPYIAVYGRDIPQELHGELEDVLPLIRIMPDASGAPEFVDRRFPRGRVIMSLGKGGSAEAETRAIAASNNIKDAPFTDEVLASVMPEFVIPSPQMLQEMGRRDLRQEEFVCTIDPATARDLDDALSITKTSGGYRVGVHIADVSFFVPLDSEVDLEARSRATSTYFVERVIPMLPHKLCEDYCSLNAGEDKFAFSCIFQMDNDCKITSEWFGQSVIRNRCRMAYEDAQRIIDGDTSGDSLVFHAEELKLGVSRADLIKKVVSSVQMLFKVAQHMRARRFEDGSLTLNKNKLKFKFDDINARVAPIGFELDAIHESNWMVEQFMLLANIRVAEKVVEFMPQCALVRKHPTPDRKKLKAFAKAAADHGLKVSIRSSKGLNDSLNGYKDDPRSDALRLMATYCMMLAKYVSSGDDESESIAHFALATPCYTHFTSPIRRYADLTIHRQLLLALEIESHVKRNTVKGTPDAPVDISKLHYSNYYFTHYEVDEVATRCNEQKERARKCSDASMKMFFCLYLEAIRLRAQVDATVVPFQRVSVDVVRVKDGYFTVYAAEIGTDCEIAMNAHNQHWTGECHYDSKDNIFKINWGGEGEGEENEETVGLFHRFTALLAVKHDQGMMKLDMIIDRPEHRDVAVGVRRLL